MLPLQPAALGTLGAIRGHEAPAVGGQGWRSFAPPGGLGSAGAVCQAGIPLTTAVMCN